MKFLSSYVEIYRGPGDPVFLRHRQSSRCCCYGNYAAVFKPIKNFLLQSIEH